MKNNFSLSQKLLWTLTGIVIVGVITTGILTNITLRSVEKRLPGMLLKELNDLSLVLDSLADVVDSARIAKDKPNPENLSMLQKKIGPLYNNIVRLRESYVMDNLVQASAFHAVVAPAIADLQIWLSDGISGLGPDNKATVTIGFLRMHEAYQKAQLLNRESRIGAQAILIKQQERLGHFIFNANLLFVLTMVITLGMIFLLIRQYTLQLKESKAQSELREQRDLLTSLFENFILGIIVWDKKENLLFCNKGFTEITGYSSKEIKSLKDWFLIAYPDKEYRNKVLRNWKDFHTKPATIHQIKVTCKTGDVKDIECRGNFLKDGRILLIMSDNTWRAKAEKEKQKAQRVATDQKKMAFVGEVAGKMAHDFNNILGIIMGNTELSLMDCKDRETKKTLKLIFQQTLRGKNLTKNLIAFAKDQEPKQEFFKLNDKIELVLNLMQKDLEGIEIIKEVSTGAPAILADPGMIEHGLVNLIQNSIHALSMVKNPKIIIRTYKLDDNLCFEIEDNGNGIPKEHLESIYEPSFSLKGSNDVTQSYKNGIKGTGYGMANVKKYIEMHKGCVSVESEFGSGTKFTIQLPIIQKELTSKEKTAIQKETTQFVKYILLVEDEQSLSEIQYKILTQDPCNHKVDIAVNGQVAIDLFNRNKYDCISLDYILPGGINGMDVYNHIREINKTIPIFIVSGNIEFLESIKELQHNDNKLGHISKPCQNKDYLEGINKLLEQTLTKQ